MKHEELNGKGWVGGYMDMTVSGQLEMYPPPKVPKLIGDLARPILV